MWLSCRRALSRRAKAAAACGCRYLVQVLAVPEGPAVAPGLSLVTLMVGSGAPIPAAVVVRSLQPWWSAKAAKRVEPEGCLPGGRDVLLVRMRVHQVRVHLHTVLGDLNCEGNTLNACRLRRSLPSSHW